MGENESENHMRYSYYHMQSFSGSHFPPKLYFSWGHKCKRSSALSSNKPLLTGCINLHALSHHPFHDWTDVRCRTGAPWCSTAGSTAPASTWKTSWWRSAERRYPSAPSGSSSPSGFLPLTTLSTQARWRRAQMTKKLNRQLRRLADNHMNVDFCCILIWNGQLPYPSHW